MKKDPLGALIALNTVLMLALLLVLLLPGPSAEAQRRGRGRGDYAMVAGQVTGRSDQSAIYLLELNSNRMMALIYDSRGNRLQILAGRNLAEDLDGRGDRR